MKIKLMSFAIIFLVGCSIKGETETILKIDSMVLDDARGNIENLSDYQDYEINVDQIVNSGNIEDIETPALKYKTLPFDMLNKAPICKKFYGKGVKITNNSDQKDNERIVSNIAQKVNDVFGCELSIEYEITDSNLYEALINENGVVISNGLISDSKYIDEVFFVVAHEIVHKILLHGEQISLMESKRDKVHIKEAQDTYEYLKSIEVHQEADEFVKNYNQLHLTTNNLKVPHEVAADILAVDILVRAGYSPQATKYTLERIASCLGYNDGDLNKNFAELQKMAESFNENANIEKYAAILSQTMKHTHLPSPWRETTVTNYIKANYPAQRRLKMTPMRVNSL
ncbi:M48 family metalloprotease [Vibrio fortis]|uniref:M48 family metalloprotease n=1 Tax=Vibrio fortis TaxID=212667 RepID=UPI002F3EE10C